MGMTALGSEGVVVRGRSAITPIDGLVPNHEREIRFLRDFGFARHAWWTGKPPVVGVCPGMRATGVIGSLPVPDTKTCSRASILDYFDNTWTLTEVLFSSLRGETAFLALPPHRLRQPLIFYYVHVAAFYINKLRVAGLVDEAVDAEFERQFETGVDEMRWDDVVGAHEHWPSLAQARAYRRRVYEVVRRLIASHPGLAPGHVQIDSTQPLWALLMAFEHERIHLETSSVLIREQPIELVAVPPEWPALERMEGAANLSVASDGMLELAAREVALGKPPDAPTFGWDNEYGAKRVRLHAFRASRTLVTNAAFLEFVRAGGYRERRYWCQAGWAWRHGTNAKWPTFWVPDGPAGSHLYRLRTCFEQVDFASAWPVEVNQYEARAYCAWLTEHTKQCSPFRLLTEAEHVALRPAGKCDRITLGEGRGESASERHNLNFAFGGPTSVTAFSPTSDGFYDVFGNVWQRCEDHFAPLPGFAAVDMYEDFSTPCFDGQHFVIMGGSFVSTGDEASCFARFHFRPHFHQHAGFRLAQAVDPERDNLPVRIGNGGEERTKYENDACVAAYLQLHHGDDLDSMPLDTGPTEATRFPQRVAELAIEALREHGHEPGRALDLGCAVGGTSFALARWFESVDGVDQSPRFVALAGALGRGETVEYELIEEGEHVVRREARVDTKAIRGSVHFQPGDACALPDHMRGYDAVIMANLVCRLADPYRCLAQLLGSGSILNPGGIVVITAPNSWNTRFTPPEKWLSQASRGCMAFDRLEELLGTELELLSRRDMPLLIREHRRKYEYIIADATVWRKRQ